MLKGSEIKEKSIIVINGLVFFVAFKSSVAGQPEKTILIGLTVDEIIRKKFWPINDGSYEFLQNYVVDESGISCDNQLCECRRILGLEKMRVQVKLINNQLSAVASYLN